MIPLLEILVLVKPIFSKEYNIPHALREDLYKQAHEML